jgi:hypothetical protein
MRRINTVIPAGIPSAFQNAKNRIMNTATFSLTCYGYGTLCLDFSEEHESQVPRQVCWSDKTLICSRSSLTGIVTTLTAGWSGVRMVTKCFSSKCADRLCGLHSPPLNAHRGSYLGVRRPGHKVDYWPSTAEVNEWRYASASPVFLYGVVRDDFAIDVTNVRYYTKSNWMTYARVRRGMQRGTRIPHTEFLYVTGVGLSRCVR